ncbi:hypothetical protein ACIOHE_06650 [Streptomyces sp. NPDC087851]|uniref:hypothetical protein n=1 Tax=Streptomyces sp. NPDC087851 TaxID=3365810 RepID=UPI0037FF3063
MPAGPLTGGQVEAVPEVRGRDATRTGVAVALDVPARAACESVAFGFVTVAGLGLLQRAQLAQRLKLIGGGGDPGGFAQLGFPHGGGRSFGGEAGLDDVGGVGGQAWCRGSPRFRADMASRMAEGSPVKFFCPVSVRG